jgi:PAS domain S-box-containing protein
MLAVPIVFRGQNVGSLYLGNKTTAEEFSDDDQRTVQMLAALAATGLGHGNLISAVNRERMTLRQVLDAVPDGIIFIEAETGNLLASSSFEALISEQIRTEAGADQQLGILHWPNGLPLTHDELPSTRALQGEATPDVELLVVRRDGSRVPVSERTAPVCDSGGRIIGAVCAFRDISAAKEVDRLREEFAAMVAHEQLNPIQSILLQVRLLRDRANMGTPPSTTVLDRLDRAGARLLQMASDLLQSARIELARVRLDRSEVDVVECVKSLVDTMVAILGNRRLELTVEGCPPCLMLDRTRFEQIITNVLENAAKYSPAITTIRTEVAVRDAGVEIAVHDQGMGIAPDEIPKLFDRFYQTRRARERKISNGRYKKSARRVR